MGEKFGFVIQKIFTVISGISISFIVNWKLSLIVLTVSPITIFFIIYFTSSLKKSAKITKDAYEQAGGIAEEILYNIQTICSFGNYNYEQYRFNSKIDVVFNCDKSKALKYGISQSLIGLSTYIAFTIAIFYGKKLMIDKAAAAKEVFEALNKGRAILDLTSSLIKYAAVIVLVFMVLKTLGVDTTAILAGIGILGLVVGLVGGFFISRKVMMKYLKLGIC